MLNKVVLVGRLVKDAELKATQSGKSVASFTMAVDSGYGENKKADFINCVAWNKTAEFVTAWFKKGDMIAVAGRLSTRTYDGTDGQKKYVTEVVVSEVEFCGGKKDDTEVAPTITPDMIMSADDSDLPF